MVQRHDFTATSAATGSERVFLQPPGRLKYITVEANGAPVLTALEIGRHGQSMRLDEGYIRGSDIDVTNLHALKWQGDLRVESYTSIIVFWDNRTGANVGMILEYEVEV